MSTSGDKWVRSFSVRERSTKDVLLTVRVDRYGTPDRKLPDCPRCEEDELWAHPNRTGFLVLPVRVDGGDGSAAQAFFLTSSASLCSLSSTVLRSS